MGTVRLTWVGTLQALEAKVTQAYAPNALELGDMRWELEPFGGGTRLTLWHTIDRRFISWGGRGLAHQFRRARSPSRWCPIGRIIGDDAMKFDWQRLCGVRQAIRC